MRHERDEDGGLEQACKRVQRELRTTEASRPRDIVVGEILPHIDRVGLDQAITGTQDEHGGTGHGKRPGERQRPRRARDTLGLTGAVTVGRPSMSDVHSQQ
jgi:hypothetical protein